MVFDKMAAICPDFKWLGFRISDPIQNLDHLQPNLFWTIQNPDYVGFQIPTVLHHGVYSGDLKSGLVGIKNGQREVGIQRVLGPYAEIQV